MCLEQITSSSPNHRTNALHVRHQQPFVCRGISCQISTHSQIFSLICGTINNNPNPNTNSIEIKRDGKQLKYAIITR